MPDVGRAFSSCLRNGLRMMGMVAYVLVEEVVFVKDVDLLLGSDRVHNATGRQVARAAEVEI